MPIYEFNLVNNFSNLYYADEFVGAAYDNRAWAVTGTGSIASTNSLGGIVTITGSATNSYRVSHGNIGAFSVANQAKILIQGAITLPSTGQADSGAVYCGLHGTTNPTAHYCSFKAIRGTANYQCATGNGSESLSNSGIAVNTATHEFRIECYSGSILFFIDGALVANKTTNITTQNLQPTIICTGSSNPSSAATIMTVDRIEVMGIRA